MTIHIYDIRERRRLRDYFGQFALCVVCGLALAGLAVWGMVEASMAATGCPV